jgi:hypothetical protein
MWESVGEQRRRASELDGLRLRRQLTTSERREADRLAHKLYMREWRKL